MKLYFAPMEGITGYLFRNTFNKYFGKNVDKYYTPFLTPCEKIAIAPKEIRQILPENNKGVNLVPQIITARADDFNMAKRKIREYGYSEINLNLGCPSGTVTSKGRGAGALGDTDRLDRLLDGIFADGDENISVKTRIGISEPEEFERILDIYVKYPICELTIHPRLLKQMYTGIPYIEVFLEAVGKCPFNVCYNGDIFSTSDYGDIVSKCSAANLSGIMIGRGALSNPLIFEEIADHRFGMDDNWSMDNSDISLPSDDKNQRIYMFMKELEHGYMQLFSGSRPVLYKLKEIWSYLKSNYDDERTIRKMLKTNSLEEFDIFEKKILLDR